MGGPQGDGATSFGDEAVPLSQRPDDEARDALTVCFGGLASEIACLTEGSNGALGDIQSASELALSRIRSGVTEEPAPVDLYCLQGNVAESLKEAYAKDLQSQLASARLLAIAIVAANVEGILRFAATLEAAGELTGEALQRAIADAGFAGAETRVQ